jgi:CBS domain-containing protein
VVSARDIVAKVVAKGLDPREVTLAELAEPADALALDVGIPVEEAVSIMARHQRAHLPVTEGDRVVGFVTRRDAARSLAFMPPWADD